MKSICKITKYHNGHYANGNQASINLTIAIEKIAAKRQTTQMSRGATNLLVASCRDAIIIGHEYSE